MRSICVSNDDVFGQAILVMTGELRALIVEIRSSAEMIAATYLHETVESLERMVTSTEKLTHLSQNTIQNALNGQETVEQVSRSMEKIQQTVTTADYGSNLPPVA